ncbi:MAG TPA: DUF58 domain-containing protein [Candidatus Baltobacteraceae bacterium]|nr:DUF58 domain-containing protein [Candidatus Baltobacteraceae bacterium]
MIAPRDKFLFWTAAIVLPFALLMAVAPNAIVVSLALIAGLLLIAIADAFGARKSLAGIGIELLPVVRMSKDREGKLELRIRNQRKMKKNLRVGLAWPREIKVENQELDALLPARSEWSRLTWPCTPLKRGNYKLQSAHIETASPLGFWAVRKTLPAQSEIRVYPNLLGERKNLAALFLNRGAFGWHAQRQVGKGRDFEKLREYVPGDGYDEIHWKATARRGKPITKVFQIEKTQEVYVIVDSSRLSARQSTENTEMNSTLERYVTAALVLGLAAERQGDLFGLVTFADKVQKFVRAKNGEAHYNACRDALYTLEPKIVTPDFDELCAFIRLRLRRRALLIFLTALDDPAIAENSLRNIELIRRQHLVLVNMIQPAGVKPLFAGPNVAGIDDLYWELGGHLRWQKLRELQKILQRRGVQFSLLANERLSAELVSQYLNVKRRQLL